MKRLINFLIPTFLFISLVVLGLKMAVIKPLWTDELYSLGASTIKMSYAQIVAGQIDEGNNAPFFYVWQKIFYQLSGYQAPGTWLEGNWGDGTDALSQWITRLLPIVCMSLSVMLIFVFAGQRLGVGAAILSFMVFVSSHMFWVYLAEARPYALIVLLSTVQALIVNRMVHEPRQGYRYEPGLMVVHVFMALTSVCLLLPIAAAGLVLGLQRRWRPKQYAGTVALPAALSLFYYLQAPHYDFHFNLSIQQLIRDSFPTERLNILGLFLLVWLTAFILKKIGRQDFVQEEPLRPAIIFSCYVTVTLILTVLLLTYMWIIRSELPQGFPLTSRYFIYLMPLGVILAVLAAFDMSRAFSRYRILQMILWGIILFWVIKRLIKVAPGAIKPLLGV